MPKMSARSVFTNCVRKASRLSGAGVLLCGFAIVTPSSVSAAPSPYCSTFSTEKVQRALTTAKAPTLVTDKAEFQYWAVDSLDGQIANALKQKPPKDVAAGLSLGCRWVVANVSADKKIEMEVSITRAARVPLASLCGTPQATFGSTVVKGLGKFACYGNDPDERSPLPAAALVVCTGKYHLVVVWSSGVEKAAIPSAQDLSALAKVALAKGM
jgi:hypothetical protein